MKGLDLGEMQERDPQIDDPYATTAMLSGLLSTNRYRVYIWARTSKGRGESYFIEIITTEAGGACLSLVLHHLHLFKLNSMNCWFHACQNAASQPGEANKSLIWP